MRFRLLLAVASTLAFGLVLGSPPGHATETPGCSVLTAPLFNEPAGTEPEQYRIVHYIEACIYASKRGSYISIASPHYEDVSISKALIWADKHDRHVRVIIPKNLWREEAVKMLRKQLGTDTSRGSYLKLCRNSCLTDKRDGSMHNKLFLFSSTGGVENVTLISSINAIAKQSETRYNDLFRVNDGVIYDATFGYFRDMKYNQPAEYPAMVATDDYEIRFLPTTDPDQPDHYLQQLNRVRCDTTKRAGENGHTTVDWMAAQLQNTPYLADRAVKMTERGCHLRILLSLDNTGRKTLWTLHRGGVKVRYLWSQQDDYLNHSKVLIISGTYGGKVVDTVDTGTLNAVDSRSSSDNTMLRIKDSREVRQAYTGRFEEIWSTAHPLTEEAIQAYVASQHERRRN